MDDRRRLTLRQMMIAGRLAEHWALYHQLESGERIDTPEAKLAVYRLAYGRYLRVTGRIGEQC